MYPGFSHNNFCKSRKFWHRLSSEIPILSEVFCCLKYPVLLFSGGKAIVKWLFYSSFEIYNGLIHGISVEGSGISVLRTFRLLRILKLVRFLPNLRRQLVVMLRTMDNVAVFFALLMLFIFIFRYPKMHHIIPQLSLCNYALKIAAFWAWTFSAVNSVTEMRMEPSWIVTGKISILYFGPLWPSFR